MIFNNFQIGAMPFIHDAYCKCGNKLEQVSNGLLSKAMYCPKCELVYRLELRQVPKRLITKDFIKQCRKR